MFLLVFSYSSRNLGADWKSVLRREARVARVGPPTRREATPRSRREATPRRELATVRREARVGPPRRELATVRDKEAVLEKR